MCLDRCYCPIAITIAVFTKENVAAKALADQVNDLSPPTLAQFGRLFGRIEKGKGKAYATRIDVRYSDRNPNHLIQTDPYCDWAVCYGGNVHAILHLQPMVVQDLACIYG